MFGDGKSSYDLTAEDKAAQEKRIADEMAVILAEARAVPQAQAERMDAGTPKARRR